MSAHRFRLAILAVVLVAAGPPAAAQPKPLTDQFGDPLPAGAIGQLGTTRLRHACDVWELAFLPDGKTLASVDYEGATALWDLETGKERRYFRIGAGGRVWAAFSPDMQRIACSQENTFRVYDLATGKLRFQKGVDLDRPGDGPQSPVSFSGDGRILAGASSDRLSVHLWDAASGEKLRTLDMRKPNWRGGAALMLPSPDGKLLLIADAVGPLAEAVIWELATGKPLHGFRVNAWGPILAFAPDSKTLAHLSEDSMTVMLRQTLTGTVDQALHHAAVPSALALSSDGKTLAIGGRDGRVRFWDVPNRKDAGALQCPNGRVARLRFSRDGRCLVSATDLTNVRDVVQVWQLANGKELLRHDSTGWGLAPEGWNFGWSSCALSDNGTTLAMAARQTIRLIDVATGKERHPPQGHHSPVVQMAVAPNSRQIATAADKMIRHWDANAQVDQWHWLVDYRGMPHLGFTAGGRMLAFIDGDTGIAILSDMAAAYRIRQIQTPTDSGIRALAPDGRFIASEMADAMVLFDVRTGKPRARLAMPDDLPGPPLARLERRAVFAPDGKRLAAIDGAANNGQYRLHKPGQMQLIFVQYKTEIGRVIQWDLVTGREMPRLAHVGQKILAITYSPDGRIVAGLGQYYDGAKRSNEDIHLWEAATGAAVGRIEKPSAGMRCLAFAPDGRRLAVGSVDGSIRLWDVATGKLLEQLDGHRGEISALQFASDGNTLLSGSADTTVLIWDMTRPMPGQGSSDLPPKTLDDCWAELTGADPVKAYRAVWTMASVPTQTVPFLGGRLKRFVPPEEKRIRQWIADLDSDDYESRQGALQSLADLGDRIEPLVKEALKRNISLEMRRRLEQLPSMPRAVPSRQEVRAMQILELIGTAEARTLLDVLHRGAGGAGALREAGESLERLARRLTSVRR